MKATVANFAQVRVIKDELKNGTKQCAKNTHCNTFSLKNQKRRYGTATTEFFPVVQSEKILPMKSQEQA
ncbi:MAG: hypothetical protein WCQ99_11955 [Pseudomonadota bacterium]